MPSQTGELRGADLFERLNRPSRQNQSAGGARKRQDQSFDQQLPHDAAARGAEGAAKRQLRLARAGAGEQQTRDVRARHEQQQRHRRHQDLENRPHAAHDPLAQRHQAQTPRLVLRVRRLELACHDVHLRLRLRQRRAGLQATDQPQRVEAPDLRIGIVERERQIEIDGFGKTDEAVVGKREARRHDARNGVRPALDDDRPADDVGGAVEPLLPQAMADDDGTRSRGFVRPREVAAERRDGSERGEEFCAHPRRAQPDRRTRSGDRDARRADRHGAQPLEHLVAVAIVDEVRRRDGRRIAAAERPVHPDEPVRVAVRQRLQQHAVDDREHAGGGADAQCQCRDDEGSEHRLAPDQAEGVAQVTHATLTAALDDWL